MLDTAGAGDRSGFPRVHPKEHVRWPCTVALGHKRRERWHTIGYLRKHRRPFHSVKGVGAVITSQLPVSCSVRAFSPTCSTPPGMATPNCLTSRLISSNRGLHCRIVPAVMRLLHDMPTQTGRLFSPSAVRLDCRKSCQYSGGNASSSSTSLL